MTRKEIKNRVIEIVSNEIGIDQNEIFESTRFREDLGTDSLDDVELLMEFEREYGITIKDEEMRSVGTVREAIDAICKKFDVLICKQQAEVDLEKELGKWRHEHFEGKRDGDYSGEYLERKSQLELASHFYELGRNARKEE